MAGPRCTAPRNGSGFNFGGGRSTAGFILDGIRIHNVWDGIRPRGNAGAFHIKNVWVSDARDDCLENDYGQSGVVEDFAVRGLSHGHQFPARQRARQEQDGGATGIGAGGAPAGGGDGVLEIRNTLMSLGPHPKPNAKRAHFPWFKDPGHGMFFKLAAW